MLTDLENGGYASRALSNGKFRMFALSEKFALRGYRLYALSKKLYLAIIFWTLAFLCFVFTFALSMGGVQSATFASYLAEWAWALIVVLSLGATTDIGITVTLIFLLLRGRSKFFRKTTALVEKLIRWTIETCMMTSLCSLLVLICFVTMKPEENCL
ncbi:hypothetical protein GGX14DRAFT_610869 [Mycena pura]|uniref:DUF6534 domain-containing protein n=1 Tax=Mycena pura TaxID=153505 RepID=A0AAD6VRK3_9AGAR|nr:hypothetical protein GGX14DRAFT_610869 [Mycena pura]